MLDSPGLDNHWNFIEYIYLKLLASEFMLSLVANSTENAYKSKYLSYRNIFVANARWKSTGDLEETLDFPYIQLYDIYDLVAFCNK